MRELSIRERLSIGVMAMIKEEESHPTQEVKSSKGTGVGSSREMDLRVKKQGSKEKI